MLAKLQSSGMLVAQPSPCGSKVEIKQNNQNHIGDMVFYLPIHDATLLM
jgi:hypothetical protein